MRTPLGRRRSAPSRFSISTTSPPSCARARRPKICSTTSCHPLSDLLGLQLPSSEDLPAAASSGGGGRWRALARRWTACSTGLGPALVPVRVGLLPGPDTATSPRPTMGTVVVVTQRDLLASGDGGRAFRPLARLDREPVHLAVGPAALVAGLGRPVELECGPGSESRLGSRGRAGFVICRAAAVTWWLWPTTVFTCSGSAPIRCGCPDPCPRNVSPAREPVTGPGWRSEKACSKPRTRGGAFGRGPTPLPESSAQPRFRTTASGCFPTRPGSPASAFTRRPCRHRPSSGGSPSPARRTGPGPVPAATLDGLGAAPSDPGGELRDDGRSPRPPGPGGCRVAARPRCCAGSSGHGWPLARWHSRLEPLASGRFPHSSPTTPYPPPPAPTRRRMRTPIPRRDPDAACLEPTRVRAVARAQAEPERARSLVAPRRARGLGARAATADREAHGPERVPGRSSGRDVLGGSAT